MSTAVAEGTFTAEQFVDNATLYNQSAKLRRAFDAVMACGCDNIEDTVAHIEQVRDALRVQSENGAGYTPDKALGFGSENASGIADTLLCRRKGAGTIRTLFAKVAP
ncbi:MAG: hypothetical protein GWN55_06890 [Phycisphaerae bacterium]|nr:hypothetical protein [Phycisphaerae bacterium]NIU25707.1 hypothetical protein [candidate division KSB1 bacterium]NIP55092.1 hypothetical protein [Phycisphaerae bacterium]NIS52700.1 hypothetical protein [Phycisphaerae bacterium]NIV01036.1 hypothetical protein [Phycisphaerae bacterium]